MLYRCIWSGIFCLFVCFDVIHMPFQVFLEVAASADVNIAAVRAGYSVYNAWKLFHLQPVQKKKKLNHNGNLPPAHARCLGRLIKCT